MASSDIDHHKVFEGIKKALTKYQESLHLPENVKLGKDHPSNIVYSAFYREYHKTTFNYRTPEELPSTQTGSKLRFKARAAPHGLLATDLCQHLPSIACQDGYEARWTWNVGSNVMESGRLTLNERGIQAFDYVSNDQDGQSQIEAQDREARDANIGNIRALQEWNDKLPSHTTSYTIPWFYTLGPGMYFPLYMCSIQDELMHEITIRNDLAQLLMVRRKSDGVQVPPDRKSIAGIDGKAPGDAPKLPLPTMWGDYLLLSDLECAYNVCNGSDIKNHHPGPQRNILYVDNIIAIDQQNASALGATVSLPIENTEFPVHSFAWVAQNVDAAKAGYYSNYSTDASNHNAGASPIAQSTLHLGKGYLFRDMPAYRNQRVYPGRQYMCTPVEPGYNFWSMGMRNQSRTDLKPGIVIKGGHLSVNLHDTNPFIGLTDGVRPSTSLFKVRLRMTYTKRIVFVEFPTNEKERNTSKRATFETHGTE